MKKSLIALIVLVLGATTTLFAQEKSPKVMIQERIDYMKKNLTLTGQENNNFWKVYE